MICRSRDPRRQRHLVFCIYDRTEPPFAEARPRSIRIYQHLEHCCRRSIESAAFPVALDGCLPSVQTDRWLFSLFCDFLWVERDMTEEVRERTIGRNTNEKVL